MIPTHGKDCGPKDLIAIDVSPLGDGYSEVVVRWCQRCGAIVKDVDFDGRTNPGELMPMRFPTYK